MLVWFVDRVSRELTEEDNDQLNREPDAVENVVFPSEVLETDRVDVLVENQGDLDTQVHQPEFVRVILDAVLTGGNLHETLGTDVVR